MQRICLIGPSGIGKSYWSAKLAEQLNYHLISADEQIASDIFSNLNNFYSELANWLGVPWDSKKKSRGLVGGEKFPSGTSNPYAERRSAYLKSENWSLQQALSGSEPTIYDSSGSLVYCAPDLIARLQSEYQVIYLKADLKTEADLKRNYLAAPDRPIIWTEALIEQIERSLKSDCLSHEQLSGFYDQLLTDRKDRYSRLAGQTITVTSQTTIEDFLALIR